MEFAPANCALSELKSEGLMLWQPLKGYRFSIDALLLGDFVQIKKKNGQLLELGAGCGVISLILAKRNPRLTVLSVEVQEILVACAQANVLINGLAQQVEIIQADFTQLQDIIKPGSFDYVVSNPPYRHPATGRLCLNACEALARHEILMDFPSLCKTAHYALSTNGRFYLIYAAEFTAKAIAILRLHGLEPKRLRFVHSRFDSPARLVLIEACKGCGEELRVDSPIFLQELTGYVVDQSKRFR